MAKLTLQAAAKRDTSRQTCSLAWGREVEAASEAHTNTNTHLDVYIQFNNVHKTFNNKKHTAPYLFSPSHHLSLTHTHTHSLVDKSVLSCSVVCLALFYCVSIIEKEQSPSFTIPMVTHVFKGLLWSQSTSTLSTKDGGLTACVMTEEDRSA